MLIVGEKEAETNSVSVRRHGHGDLGSMSLSDFTGLFEREVAASMGS
jgi:threonyl-tRNA synthetase